MIPAIRPVEAKFVKERRKPNFIKNHEYLIKTFFK